MTRRRVDDQIPQVTAVSSALWLRSLALAATCLLLASTEPSRAGTRGGPSETRPGTPAAAPNAAGAGVRSPVAPRAGHAMPGGCRIRAEITPEEAFVGQQLLYRISIERSPDFARTEWLRSPGFPDFRSEWLPGRPEREVISEDGSIWLVQEMRRSLFPSRPGELEISGGTIVCRRERPAVDEADASTPDGTATAASNTAGRPAGPDLQIELAALRVAVARPPSEGRPQHFAGLVGPVRLQLSVFSARVRLGEAIRASVVIRGAGNLWDQPNPFDPSVLGPPSLAADVFEGETKLDLQRGDRLQARAFHRFELVPREPGLLRIPPVRVSYFDPDSSQYRDVTTSPAEVWVLAETSPDNAGDEPKASGGKSTDSGDGDPAKSGAGLRGMPPLLPGLLFVLLLAAGIGIPLYTKRRERGRAVRHALRQAEAAAARDDPRAEAAALERALRAALRTRAPELAMLSTAELEQRTAQSDFARKVASALAALERTRFDASVRSPDHEAVAALIRSELR